MDGDGEYCCKRAFGAKVSISASVLDGIRTSLVGTYNPSTLNKGAMVAQDYSDAMVFLLAT